MNRGVKVDWTLKTAPKYCSLAQSILDQSEYHNRIFNVCFHFTNSNMKFHPMRKEPHVLLCKSDIPLNLLKRFLRDFMRSPKVFNLGKYLTHRIRSDHNDKYIDEFEVEAID